MVRHGQSIRALGKTNINVDKKLREKLKELAGDQPLVEYLREIARRESKRKAEAEPEEAGITKSWATNMWAKLWIPTEPRPSVTGLAELLSLWYLPKLLFVEGFKRDGNLNLLREKVPEIEASLLEDVRVLSETLDKVKQAIAQTAEAKRLQPSLFENAELVENTG